MNLVWEKVSYSYWILVDLDSSKMSTIDEVGKVKNVGDLKEGKSITSLETSIKFIEETILKWEKKLNSLGGEESHNEVGSNYDY